MSPDTEELLKKFIHDQKEADALNTLKRIWDWCMAHDKQDDVRHAEIHGEIRGLSLRVGALEKDSEKLEDRVERSGSWDREALQAQNLASKEEANWWKRNWLAIVATVVGIAAAAKSFMGK